MTDLTDRELIEERLRRLGLTPTEWRDGEDGLEAALGRWRVVDENEDAGLYHGDEGVLVASVVGAVQHGNRRVHFALTPEGTDGGVEVDDLTALEFAA